MNNKNSNRLLRINLIEDAFGTFMLKINKEYIRLGNDIPGLNMLRFPLVE